MRFPDTNVTAEGDLLHMALLAEMEPVSLEQAMKEPKWIDTMEEELSSIERNNTWKLTDLPPRKKPIAVR